MAEEDGGGEAKFIKDFDEVFSKATIGGVLVRIKQVGIFDGTGKGPVEEQHPVVASEFGKDFVPQ